jgi:hypothetical protein
MYFEFLFEVVIEGEREREREGYLTPLSILRVL